MLQVNGQDIAEIDEDVAKALCELASAGLGTTRWPTMRVAAKLEPYDVSLVFPSRSQRQSPVRGFW